MAGDIIQNIQESLQNNDNLLPMRDMSDYFDILNAVLQDVQRSNQLYDNDVKEREHVMERLTHALKKTLPHLDSLHEEVLEPVGSMVTELSTKKSDLNFSLKTSKNKELDRAKLMDGLNQRWMKDPLVSAYFYDVRLSKTEGNPRYRPILKFKDIKTRICCDLTLSDKIGKHASDLMSAYAKWDERFQMLGHSMKHLTRVCKIDRSAEGGLSNYVYLIMVIFFLQKTMPPVLPVLQEISAGNMDSTSVDGCNVWFFKEEQPGRHATPNTKSAGRLWLDMLRFYAFDFGCKSVVSVSTKAFIPWDKASLVVLDPFDRGNNICKDLSDTMTSRIMQVFKKASERFKTLPGDNWTGQIKDYFFDHNALVGSIIPESKHESELSKSGHPEPDKFTDRRSSKRQRPHRRHENN